MSLIHTHCFWSQHFCSQNYAMPWTARLTVTLWVQKQVLLNHRIIQVGRDLRQFLIQPSAQRMASSGIKPGCSGLGPAEAWNPPWTTDNKWAGNLFNKEKCPAFHLGRSKPMHQCRLGTNGLESSFAIKDLWVLVDTKMNTNHQCALVAKAPNSTLGCWKSVASRLKELIFPLHSTLAQHIWSSRSSVGFHSTRKVATYCSESSAGPQRWLREYMTYEERLRELGLLSLEKTQEHLIHVYK